MKLTASQLKQIIKEELDSMHESSEEEAPSVLPIDAVVKAVRGRINDINSFGAIVNAAAAAAKDKLTKADTNDANKIKTAVAAIEALMGTMMTGS